jgi:glutamate-1-semialdehyde 2,1-aminomutase
MSPVVIRRVHERAKQIGEQETRTLLARTPRSAALHARAVRSLPLGVASSFQAGSPYPIAVARGRGSRVWDVDGHEYVDLHGGFGANVVGHAHPALVDAVGGAAATGTHFAAPTEVTVRFAEELCRRFGLDQVRFGNSGTEVTADAIRLSRAATGRDTVLKIEGSYHGHHDAVMFSVVPNADQMGGRDRPACLPMSRGIPADTARHVRVVPFNDLPALERVLTDHGAEIACLIMEPVMMNVGLVLPEPGYLAGVRDACRRAGVVLVFDEVKSGVTIAPGGATERFGVQPDLVCVAKAIAGGVPTAAFGGRAELMALIGRGVAQQGTFNGNPLVAAAGVATLTRVLTPSAYEHLEALSERMAAGCREAIAASGIDAHVVALGAKGCVSYRRRPLRNYRDFLECDQALFQASWPWLMNRGVFLTPGDEEQWTMSVQHTEADVDRAVDAYASLCGALTRTLPEAA